MAVDEVVIDTPLKTYTVKSWCVTLKSGHTAEFNIREDREEKFDDAWEWWEWKWPRQKRFAKIREVDIAAYTYQEIEQKELPKYEPKRAKSHEARKREEKREEGKAAAEGEIQIS